jgi:4-alpha-glucanotransferase
VITEDVLALKNGFGLPGMRVLQFGFDGSPDNVHGPYRHVRECVVYTGTHDNDTTCGWYRAASDHEKDHLRRYLGRDGSDVAWDLIRAAWASVADLAIAPLQDVLNLGTEARMNFPGHPQGNWSWRFQPDQVNAFTLARLADLTRLYARDAGEPPKP